MSYDITSCTTLVTTFDSSTLVYTLYYDGEYATETTMTNSFDITDDDLDVGLAMIGESAFSGCISIVKVWDEALSAAEISSVSAVLIADNAEQLMAEAFTTEEDVCTWETALDETLGGGSHSTIIYVLGLVGCEL